MTIPVEKAAAEIISKDGILPSDINLRIKAISRIINKAIVEATDAHLIDECIEAGNIKNTEGMSFELKGLMIINALEGYAAKQPLDEFVETIDKQQKVIDELVLAGDEMVLTFPETMPEEPTTFNIPACIVEKLRSALAAAKELEAK